MSASEARTMLKYFTESPDGTQTMDGDGNVWVKKGDAWFRSRGRNVFRIDALRLAKALCPDLVVEMEAVTS